MPAIQVAAAPAAKATTSRAVLTSPTHLHRGRATAAAVGPLGPGPGAVGKIPTAPEHLDRAGADGGSITRAKRRGGLRARGIEAVDLPPPSLVRARWRDREVERLPPGVDEDQEVVVDQRA